VIKRGLETVGRHPTPVLGGIILSLIIGLVIGLNWAGERSPAQPTVAVNSRTVTAMHFLTPDAGWVLSDATLLVTRDGGSHWRDITPGPVEPPIQLSTAYFLDAARGWTGLVGGFGTQAVRIFRTTDGGTTWRSSQVTVDQPLGISLDFIDPQRGWLMVATQASGFVSAGQLFQTVDGGVTWRALPVPPSGNPVRFVDLGTGWNVAGASFDQLYVTRDGGRGWHQLPVTIPTAYIEAAPALDLPAFVDSGLGSGLGVLRVMFADGSVQLNFSSDGGQTWRSDATLAPIFVRQPPYARNEQTVAPTFIGNGVIAVVLGKELKLQSGSGWISLKPRGFDSVLQIEFANPRVGWAVSSHLTCTGSGSSAICESHQDLLRTVDSGRSWTGVPVRYTR
jgi:photosystem II stability/assembly factor-like uncharacterized protein